MSLNWVMVPDASMTTSPSPQKSDFIPLPNERTIFKSSNRTSLSLTTPKSTYPAHSPNLSITSSDGTLYLTNQRIIYLPRANSTVSSNVSSFKSFSCALLNLHDTHLVMPWFGPNAWTAMVQPVPGGGLHSPGNASGMELKFTFKEGGAPDFQGKFEAIKERLQQVVDVAREQNGVQTSRGNVAANVDMANVHLEQLPRYEDSASDRIAPPERERQRDVDERVEQSAPASATADEVRAMAAAAATQRREEAVRRRSRGEEVERDRVNRGVEGEVPADAPPGYEEAQMESVQAELEWRSQRETERT
ncbi:hypothetical protein LTR70_000242 [Exophiala xenobiotica]|uniref:Uncharacterized protein n=1 Tax=Lithohypha guttulata TaxID=1690604 RepID=A0ABR0K459_9EURO|nr:hypothetical protein LTR24_007050 [Lithohypha guttulata]KAK5330920.1 hypothetical protein LTR70_000242 [Exophiala xenobiotica]